MLSGLEAARELHDRHLMAVGLGDWDKETNLIYHTRCREGQGCQCLGLVQLS